jgi:two-component system CheB/CheR fusion protein
MSRKYSISIIDDDETTVNIIANALRKKGHNVSGHVHVNSFFNSFKIEKPDAVLVDMIHPQMPGWQICRKIKDTPGLETIKLVAISGILEFTDMGVMNVQADAYLEKPINAEDVEAALEKLQA